MAEHFDRDERKGKEKREMPKNAMLGSPTSGERQPEVDR
jgi:hypothetical protein